MFGAIYSFNECIIENFRAKHDKWNPAMAGCATGAMLAHSGESALAVACWIAVAPPTKVRSAHLPVSLHPLLLRSWAQGNVHWLCVRRRLQPGNRALSGPLTQRTRLCCIHPFHVSYTALGKVLSDVNLQPLKQSVSQETRF